MRDRYDILKLLAATPGGMTIRQLNAHFTIPSGDLVYKLRAKGWLSGTKDQGELVVVLTEAGRAALADYQGHWAADVTEIRGKRGPVRGPCPQCGHHFRSAHVKEFCSMKCLTNSAAWRARMQAQARTAIVAQWGESSLDRRAVTCQQCGQVFFTKPADATKRKYCSKTCYRQYMTARFDRWMANPQTLALPQAYDEFLVADELPCLIAGCSWRGKALGFHVNMAHGITARAFKQMAGFNISTGLVTPEVSQAMSELKKLNPYWLGQLQPNMGKGTYKGTGTYKSLESKEHGMKARVLLAQTDAPRPPLPCRTCGTMIEQPFFGQRLYCSTPCRSKWYNRKQAHYECVCDYCGAVFIGDLHQWRRVQKGKPVCCSHECRNIRNSLIVTAVKRARKTVC